jgi:hypothetical protein
MKTKIKRLLFRWLAKALWAGLILFIILSLLAALWYGRYISADVILLMLSTITTLGGLIFTVAGLWAGYVFPEAIKIVFSGSANEDKKERIREYQSIMVPVVIGITTVLATAFAPPLVKVLQLLGLDRGLVEILKSIGVFIALSSMYLLLYSIIKIISPSILCLAMMKNRAASEDLADEILSGRGDSSKQ